MRELLNYLGLRGYSIDKEDIGRSNDNVFKIVKDNDVYYLKIGNRSFEYLSKVLKFLEGTQLNTPVCLASGDYKDTFYILMSECSGKMMHEVNPELAIPLIAKGLKMIHSVEYIDKTLIRDASYYIDLAKRSNDSLTEDDHVFLESVRTGPNQDDLVFAHGDYCLPNIITSKGDLAFIDLDNAGISFRYIDLVDCIKSITYNFKEEKYADLFLKEYGISELDTEKLIELRKLYNLLDY